ncbi:DUF1428 domain-containing protein [Paracoccus sp. PAMC 22219]|uniref:DUF1428 domain-containing protein n=1 Tax=Paracoccus sp. PAMC 22219 TaxID=1569209 RepID=UPI0005AB4DFC|nr:DUF1428 family protein [Paracoccus sp. PAMC 22219]
MTYYSGFVLAVPADKRDDYADHAVKAWPMFKRHGALRMVECWGEDVPHGKQTDFYRATQATGDEVPVFSWIEWPDRATADAAWAAMMTEDHSDMAEMPFDGARMFWGGFAPIVDVS